MTAAEKFAVTVGLKGGPRLFRTAHTWAEELQLPFLKRRRGESLAKMRERYGLAGLLVATARGPQVDTEEGVLRYHPGMAVLRVQELERGHLDHFVDACELKPGDRVLDCTLGLAADAAIASYVTGPSGKVVGLEASPLIWKVVSEGLKTYSDAPPELVAALRRITAIRANAREYIRTLPDDSFSVVYLDPMFQTPVAGSSNMQPLRPAAFHEEPDRAFVEAALRVAPRVVVKERYRGYMEKLGASEIRGGRYSRVKYGIIRRQ
jgi:16S rRNA (guanine1516-N2)-methyltransferase